MIIYNSVYFYIILLYFQDKRWCNKDYKFALYLAPPSKCVDGEYIMGAKEDWIERMNLFIDDLSLLLSLDYHRYRIFCFIICVTIICANNYLNENVYFLNYESS